MEQGSAEWHEWRRGGIGGSEISSILGVNPWNTPLMVWKIKTGQVKDWEGNNATEWGSRLEHVILSKYEDEHDVTLEYGQDLYENGIIRASRDAYNARDGVLVEAKTAWQEWDELPEYYWMQVQWYMGAFGLDTAVVLCLASGKHYSEWPVDFDENWYKSAVNFAENWWQQHIVDGFPPAATAGDLDDLRKQPVTGEVITIPASLADELRQANAVAKGAEKELADLKARIQQMMGGAVEAQTDDGTTVCKFAPRKGSLRFDAGRFEVDHPDLYQQYRVRGEPTRTFTIATNKEKK